MSLNVWVDYDGTTGLVSRLSTAYEREQHARDHARDTLCKAIVLACCVLIIWELWS